MEVSKNFLNCHTVKLPCVFIQIFKDFSVTKSTYWLVVKYLSVILITSAGVVYRPGREGGGAMVDAERKGQALMSEADKKCRTVGHLFGSLFAGQVNEHISYVYYMHSWLIYLSIIYSIIYVCPRIVNTSLSFILSSMYVPKYC